MSENPICICEFPQICKRHKIRVYFPEINQCKATGQPSPAISRTCRDCNFQGLPALAPSGKQIGSEGCGCTSESIPSGVLWWECDHPVNVTKSAPIREDRARNCPEFQPKERA